MKKNKKGGLLATIMAQKPAKFKGYDSFTPEVLEKWCNEIQDAKPSKVQFWGDMVEYVLAMPDEVFRVFCRRDNCELFVNSNQLKRFKERCKKLKIATAPPRNDKKKYG